MEDELEEQKVLAKKMREFYSSADEAAVAALNKILENKYELGGVISQAGDRFYASDPMGDKKSATFTARVMIPKGEKPVGLYHSHPGAEGEQADLFSADDVDVANRMKMLSYIKILNSGDVKKYEPGRTKTRPLSRSDRRTVSDGDLLKQEVLAKALQEKP
jgi:proteasome lid subunit RPN8/RPN11